MATLYSNVHAFHSHSTSHPIYHNSSWACLQLCTLSVLNMGTFDWLLILTMERGQWSSTTAALGGVAFVQIVTGALVRQSWHVGSWDMRQGVQWHTQGSVYFIPSEFITRVYECKFSCMESRMQLLCKVTQNTQDTFSQYQLCWDDPARGSACVIILTVSC